MLKRLLALAAMLVLLSSCAFADEAFDEKVDAVFRRYSTIGGAVVVAKDGEILYERYYGLATKRDRKPVTEDTCFRIASVTKLVSAVRVMQLVEDGTLDLDADISRYLGYGVVNPYFPDEPVTLRMVMSHTTSLNEGNGYSHVTFTLRELIGNDRKQWGNFYREHPGSRYRYSNFGAGIMGSLIEATAGENVNTSLTEHVFAPMGVNAAYSTTLLRDPTQAADAWVLATRDVKQVGYFEGTPAWDATVDPENHYRVTVGSVWMSARDLCRFGMMLCAGGTLDGVTVLRPETVALMREEQKGQGGITADTPYGLCTDRVTDLLPGTMIYGHQGLSGNIICNLYYEPESGFVFALVSNGCSNRMHNHIGRISREMFDLMWRTYAK